MPRWDRDGALMGWRQHRDSARSHRRPTDHGWPDASPDIPASALRASRRCRPGETEPGSLPTKPLLTHPQLGHHPPLRPPPTTNPIHQIPRQIIEPELHQTGLTALGGQRRLTSATSPRCGRDPPCCPAPPHPQGATEPLDDILPHTKLGGDLRQRPPLGREPIHQIAAYIVKARRGRAGRHSLLAAGLARPASRSDPTMRPHPETVTQPGHDGGVVSSSSAMASRLCS
jgi:hypothetical protein